MADWAQLQLYDARIEYWPREGTEEAFERAFVVEILKWLRGAWGFERIAFGSRRGMEARRSLYLALGLTEVVRLVWKDSQRVFYFHAPPVE